MDNLVQDYIYQYRQAIIYCKDRDLNLDEYLIKFKQVYRDLLGDECAELLFQLGETRINYDSGCVRLYTLCKDVLVSEEKYIAGVKVVAYRDVNNAIRLINP